MSSMALLRKLLWRYDGAADSARVRFTSRAGSDWEAELCLHSGTDPQSPRLMIIFRSRRDPLEPQRYTLVPPGVSKVPREAKEQLSGDDLRDLLARSVAM